MATAACAASGVEAALAALRREVETNSDYVGMNFAAEARRIHAGEAPEVLRAKVTSKGGTTAAGMLRLDDTANRGGGLDALMVEALKSARDRGAELGR